MNSLMEIRVSIYSPDLWETIEALKKRYLAANPKGRKIIPTKMDYQLPALEQGKNTLSRVASISIRY